MDRDESSYSETSENESVVSPLGSTASSYDSSSSFQCFPVADGPQYRQRAEFYRALKKLAGRRRAFTARCSRSRASSGTSGQEEENDPYNRLCIPEENGLTVDDISRLQCKPGIGVSAGAALRKNSSLLRSRTYRNPTRA